MNENIRDNGILNILSELSKISEELTNDKICQMTEEQSIEYDLLLDTLKKTNSSTTFTHGTKGKALEEIVEFLIRVSGGIFEVKTNLRTTTNEIDHLITLNAKGKLLLHSKIINPKLDFIISECKNYNKKVDVTYVGKFCSLLLSNQVKIGLLFSYKGISGQSKWNDAKGLVKKFYLSKEKEEERFCILDFNFVDFESIKKGNNLLELIDAKIMALRLDTNFINFLSKHPAEN